MSELRECVRTWQDAWNGKWILANQGMFAYCSVKTPSSHGLEAIQHRAPQQPQPRRHQYPNDPARIESDVGQISMPTGTVSLKSLSMLYWTQVGHTLFPMEWVCLVVLVVIEWDIEAYAATPPSLRSTKFPSLKIGFHAKPATLVDINGIIIMWYLPGLLPDKLQVSSCRLNSTSYPSYLSFRT